MDRPSDAAYRRALRLALVALAPSHDSVMPSRATGSFSSRCNGRLFAALARHGPIVGASGVSVGIPTSSECSPCSHQMCCESRRRAARGDIICSFKFSCRRAFFSFLFSVFSSGGLSIHGSMSAATCAVGESGDNRKRVFRDTNLHEFFHVLKQISKFRYKFIQI